MTLRTKNALLNNGPVIIFNLFLCFMFFEKSLSPIKQLKFSTLILTCVTDPRVIRVQLFKLRKRPTSFLQGLVDETANLDIILLGFKEMLLGYINDLRNQNMLLAAFKIKHAFLCIRLTRFKLSTI